MGIEESQLSLMSTGKVTLLFSFWVLPSLQQLGLINHGVQISCSDPLPREEERATEENGEHAQSCLFTFCLCYPLNIIVYKGRVQEHCEGTETSLLWSLLCGDL